MDVCCGGRMVMSLGGHSLVWMCVVVMSLGGHSLLRLKFKRERLICEDLVDAGGGTGY